MKREKDRPFVLASMLAVGVDTVTFWQKYNLSCLWENRRKMKIAETIFHGAELD